MARRDLSNLQQVTQVVPEQSGNLLGQMAQFGAQVIKQSQEAKINENLSKAQLELNALNAQYQIDYEADPFGGIDDLKAKRKEILDKYGEGVSSFFMRDWMKGTDQLSQSSDLSLQSWAYKQSRVNTVNSVNESIKNNLMLATQSGMDFANSDAPDLDAVLNFTNSKGNLQNFANKNLGPESAEQLLDNFDEDYMKSFLSGASEADPIKALQLMENDKVKASFKNPDQYMKMKDAVENRALNVQKINAEKEVLGILKNENSLLAQSVEKPIGYAQLQQEYEKGNVSKSAQEFFNKLNGYSGDGTQALNPAQQLEYKTSLYDQIAELAASPEITSAKVAKLQEQIYMGMNNKSLTEAEGTSYLNSLVAPLAAQKEQELGKTAWYNPTGWFGDKMGFEGVQDFYENNIQKNAPEGLSGSAKKKAEAETSLLNNSAKVKLYDYYYQALSDGAEIKGVAVGDIPKLSKKDRNDLYGAALTAAKESYLKDQHPQLRTLKDVPNFIYKDGALIQGMVGKRDLNANATAKPTFKLQKDTDSGWIYRVFPDGTKEFYSDGTAASAQ